MSQQDSSQSGTVSIQYNSFDSKPFQYDYFLSKSQDIFSSWNQSAIIYQFASKQERNLKYLREEFKHVKCIQKYRTAYIIRINGFIHVLKESFKELQDKFKSLILGDKKQRDNKSKIIVFGQQELINKLSKIRYLEQELKELLKYLQIILDQGLHLFNQSENDEHFQQHMFKIINSLYPYIINPKLLWDILGAQIQLIDITFPHTVSMGGNHSYYQNILHNLLKRSLKLRQIYQQISKSISQQKRDNWQKSTFLLKIIIQIQTSNINDINQRQKYDFLDCIKGMYFLSINVRNENTYYQYMFMSFHVQHLQSHRIYKDYQNIQDIFIKVLSEARNQAELMSFVQTLELNLLPFQKRKRVPQIENIALDMMYNYIGAAKCILHEEILFPEVKMVNEEQIYASSKYLLHHESANGFIDLLIRIQEYSKVAFALGSLDVHKVYLRMSDLLRKIYLSYEHNNWIFPPDILLYIPLGHFIEISDDIKADIKKTLFNMVNNLNEDHLPCKITVSKDDKLVKTKVTQGQYLQIILYFLQAVKRQQQFINLPQFLPRNRETAILYIKSLQSKLNNKQPTPDQLNYITQNLKFCQQQKLTINFSWYENKQLVYDRIKQFNIEKQLLLQWMRNIYRQTLNKRENQKIQQYFQKYKQRKLTIMKIAELLKYNHGANNILNLTQKNIKEEDLFQLLEEIRFLFLINFDIFQQSLDQEISLNYLHVCIAIYNISIKQAKGNQIYQFVMEKILVPYIKFPNSSKTKFRNKYPGFFKKWIYSFQIDRLFEVLGVYIQERGMDQSCIEDIVSKIILVRQFLDNDINILDAGYMTLEQLTMTIVSFSTIVTPFINPKVYLEAVELYCMFLNKFPLVKQETSLEFVLSSDVLSQKTIINEALKYVKAETYAKSIFHEVSILNHLILKLPTFIKNIGLVKTFEIINTYLQLKKIQKNDVVLVTFEEEMIKTNLSATNFQETLLQFIFIIKNIHIKLSNLFDIGQDQSQVPQLRTQLYLIYEQSIPKMLKIKQKFSFLQKQHMNLQNLNLTDLIFIDNILALNTDLIKVPQSNEKLKLSQIISISKDIMIDLLKKIGTNDDYIYFAEKLDLQSLILCGGQRQQQLLIDMIVQNKHKEIQTQLIKRLLRQNRKLSDAATKAIIILSKHKEKIHSYHINRFIHINSRYPNPQIQTFLIQHMGCQRNNSFAKINQQYLITDLKAKLQQIPSKLCEQLLLKPIKVKEKDNLIELISEIFEKSLYLPINKFDKTDMKIIEQDSDGQDWNTQSQNQQQQTKDKEQHVNNNNKKDKSSDKRSNSNQSKSDHQIQQQQQPQIDAQNNYQSQNSYEDQRPSFLQIFTDEARKKQLQSYNKLMIKRQELDVLLNGNYQLLYQGSQILSNSDVIDKVIAIGNILNQINIDFVHIIVMKMPIQLWRILVSLKLTNEVDPNVWIKLERQRQACKKAPKWITEYFSDRSESDDSQIEDEDDGYDDQQQGENSYYQGQGDQYNEQQNYDDGQSDSFQEQQQMQLGKPRWKKHNVEQKKYKKKAQYNQLPLLIPTYSKIQQQITGKQLKYQQLIKILQIALYMLLYMPQSQIRTKQITSFYIEIFQSNFGQIFLESFFTVIRFDQTNKNLEGYIKEQEEIYNCKVQVGLQEISMEDAINNVLYLLKEYNQKSTKNTKGNVLFLQSGTLLPVAISIINKFDLPIQNNCLTLLMIFITTNKGKIRKKIQELNYTIDEQLQNNKKEYQLKKGQLIRVIDMICKHRSSCHIWQLILETMNLKVKIDVQLLQCISGYGKHLLSKVTQTGRKIFMTIKQVQSLQKDMHQNDHLHTIQNLHHIISKLLFGCKQQIKQFYFINKMILKQIFEQQQIIPQQNYQYLNKIPKLLKKLKNKILNNKQLILLSQSMFYFLFLIKQQFYGKIQDKMFNKLIHYPKMLIQAVWYYIFMYAKKQKYIWTTPEGVQHFFKTYPMVGNYQFNNLQEVFNLILNFLSLESFCTDKFKQLFMPILMKNPILAQQIHLRFKLPTLNEDDYTNNILVTRKCSFDMAFYQKIGSGIQVEFHEEEGSDHGGLVRQLMIGWKGKGVGQESFFIGKILGISFKQGVPYGGALDISIFIAITNFTPTIKFFQQVDPQIYKSLIYIRDNDPSSLCLAFSVEKMINGKLIQFQLIQGGRKIQLTQHNKQKYLDAYISKYFYLGRQKQLKEIKKGFDSVVFPSYAQIFTPSEMLRQIRGEEVVDVKMLISKARYQGYSQQSALIKWFWQIVESFNQQRMNTFIQFVTGSPKISVFNSNFSITIEKAYDTNCLPVAHTCFNTLDLPEYSTRQILEKKLLMAISEGNNSFGIL